MPQSSPLPPADARDQAAQWLARRNNGEHNAEEQRAFLVWMNASDENRQAFAEAEALWENLRELDDVAGDRMTEARAYLRRERAKPARRRFAAAAMLAVAAGTLWYADLHSHLNDATYHTAMGERKSVDLADGSRLELDTDSSAQVHYSRHRREVRLERGRAVFTVVHGDSRHFEVFAGQGTIRDIGTQFDVRRLAGDVTVAVLDGEVEVTGKVGAAPVALRRGQQTRYTAGDEAGPVERVDINTYSAWREGKLVFQARPLREVLEELGRYQSISLDVAAPRILETPVSGVFPIDDLPQVMQTIAASLPVRITRTGERAWRIDPH